MSLGCIRYKILKLLNIYLFRSRVRVTSLLFAEQRAIHRVVLLQLHSLHLLFDRVHGGGLVCSLVYKGKKTTYLEQEPEFSLSSRVTRVSSPIIELHFSYLLYFTYSLYQLEPVPRNSIDSQGGTVEFARVHRAGDFNDRETNRERN